MKSTQKPIPALLRGDEIQIWAHAMNILQVLPGSVDAQDLILLCERLVQARTLLQEN